MQGNMYPGRFRSPYYSSGPILPWHNVALRDLRFVFLGIGTLLPTDPSEDIVNDKQRIAAR